MEYHDLAERRFAFDDERYPTYTSTEQKRVEDLVKDEYQMSQQCQANEDGTAPEGPRLHRQLHVDYVLHRLKSLPQHCMVMDSSRSWYCFWGVHALRMLGYQLDNALTTRIISFLNCCQSPSGGYAGAPGQIPHLATSYAAVMALVSLGTEEALASINRSALRAFINSMRQPNGSFVMHQGGEADTRGAYCAIAIATICSIADEQLFEGTPAWLERCQTWEGGFGGVPGCEAHGGYTCCAVTSLALLRKSHMIDMESALRWLVNRQMRFEGGFQGRTNKLVDGCYSYWLTAAFFALEPELPAMVRNDLHGLFDERGLQNYVLSICQDTRGGGLRDKPDKGSDLYHTCYALAGLSLAQSKTPTPADIIGGLEARVADVHPLFNVCNEAAAFAQSYFAKCS